MPYLTPEALPEDDVCRPLSIPASGEWLALVSGALTELTKAYNWQQFGAVTVEEAVERMQTMVNAYYDVACAACVLPGGGSVVRLSPDGTLEELNNGSWTPATGDYAIPPPATRETGTSEDQICLAAKNAVNVLEQLYENLSESWADHLTEAEALVTMTALLTTLVGVEFGPITFVIVTFMFAVFAALFAALEYLGADLWDTAFTNQLTCFLVTCANNDAGVVTFDWACFTSQLNTLANDFLLSETQLRLYIQVGYLLYFIGGADGLNLAGGTTAITSGDCDECGLWHACFYVSDDVGLWELYPSSGGEIASGFHVTTVLVGGDSARPRRQVYFRMFCDSFEIRHFRYDFTGTFGTGVTGFVKGGVWVNNFATNLNLTFNDFTSPFEWDGVQTGVTEIDVTLGTGGSDGGGTDLGDGTVYFIEITGSGDVPSQLLPYLC